MNQRVSILPLLLCLATSSHGALEVSTESVSGPDIVGNGIRLAYVADASSSDLINSGSASLLDWTSTPTFSGGGTETSFIANYMNDGLYAAGDQKNTFFDPGNVPDHFPAVVTYNLNTAIAPQGYEVKSITTFMGWATQSPIQANQIYSVEISVVGSASYTPLTSVNYQPFSGGAFAGAYESKVRIFENASGLLASGVDSIRFTFSDPMGVPGNYGRGTVIREIDVVGFAVGGDPNAIAVTTPTERQVVQRNASNVASIPVVGSFISSPDIVEARATVRGGVGNNGTSTNWQTIETAPKGGSFSGFLTNVAAGGWYEIEVRSVLNGTPSTPVVVGRVGVGDIFICAGQSNSANQGTPAYTPVSNRVVARNSISGNSWVVAADPLPIAEGTMGSPWSRLGDLLVTSQNVPIAFLSLGRNNSRVIDWDVGTLNYLTFLKPAVKSFPVNGFKALLWHQGEADGSTSSGTYRDTLVGIINTIRGADGANWSFPWYLAEASYQPSNPLTAEEGVLSGQRQVAFSLSNVFLGANTNDFHLQGRSSDGVHFNTAGLLEHARQWQEAVYGTALSKTRNGNFESNTLTSLSGVAPLAPNVFAETIPSAINGKTVFEWRILRSGGLTAADGASGYFNPGSETYSKAEGSNRLPNMSGRHVATLRGGSSGNHFLQTLRVRAKSNKTYLLSVALGRRDVGSETFGGAKIELLNGNSVLGLLNIDQNSLNTLAGGSAIGKFTNVTLRADSGTITGQAHELGIRIAKPTGGIGTYLDFDNVVLTELNTSSKFVAWLNSNSLTADPDQDTDGDGLRNLLEYAFGKNPRQRESVNVLGNRVVGAFRMTRRIGSQSGLQYTLESSTSLQSGTWTTVPGVVTTIVGVSGAFETVDLSRAAGWLPDSGNRKFYRMKVTIID